MRRRLLALASAALLAIAAWELGQASRIEAKAWLAQWLIEEAWDRASKGERHPRPWPWADTWPVARLEVPRLAVSRMLLSGASGRVMAFGPGHLNGTPLPGDPGNSVISGHRDTHFRFLRELRPGDRIEVTRPDGIRRSYGVIKMWVVEQSDTRILRATDEARLTLITCWPFDALMPGGPMRYVVRAGEVVF
jgi:sortase A